MNLACDPAAITAVLSVSLQTEEYSQIQVLCQSKQPMNSCISKDQGTQKPQKL